MAADPIADWTAPAVDRTDPVPAAGEREALESWLDYHRQTLLWKCAGLSAEQLKTRSTPPSGMSLLGLVRHMVEVERWWFRRWVGGQEDVDYLYCTDERPDGDWDDVDAADAPADLDTFHREVQAAREAARGRSLDDTFTSGRGNTLDVRWVYVHMIEEYARHNGHADLIRERIDGMTGD